MCMKECAASAASDVYKGQGCGGAGVREGRGEAAGAHAVGRDRQHGGARCCGEDGVEGGGHA